MAKRRQVRVSGGLEARSERPAKRYGVTPSRVGRDEVTTGEFSTELELCRYLSA